MPEGLVKLSMMVETPQTHERLVDLVLGWLDPVSKVDPAVPKYRPLIRNPQKPTVTPS